MIQKTGVYLDFWEKTDEEKEKIRTEINRNLDQILRDNGEQAYKKWKREYQQKQYWSQTSVEIGFGKSRSASMASGPENMMKGDQIIVQELALWKPKISGQSRFL